MGFKFLSAGLLAAVVGSGVAQAQSVGQVGGPANLPPAGFQGEQWVDNRGCVFLKAGYGGQVTWVPRVGRDRRAMCGYPPSSAARAAIEVATAEELAKPAAPAAPAPVMIAKPAPAAKPVVMASVEPVIPVAPSPKVAPLVPAAPVVRAAPAAPAAPVVAKQPAPYAKAAPTGGYEVAASNGPARGQIGCYTSAPVAERVKTRNGGTVVVCTRGDGTLTGWRPPVYPREAGVGAAISDPVMVAQGNLRHGAVAGGEADHVSAADGVIPTPPKGYKLAWEDGRLNPNRGKGTAAGWASQDQVWTRKVPAKLTADTPQAKRKKALQPGAQVTVSTKGQAATAPVQKKSAPGGAYIQVGTFGVVANADGAAARLKGLGLPVARARITSAGKAMQIVMAGPFGSAADAQAALSMARQAGFGDAFIR